MTQQFTASEVRELAATIWPDLSGREEVAEALNAFGDLLEAQEKAVPFGYAYRYWDCIRFDTGGREINGSKPTATTPLYTHPAPADTERLAEALRALLEHEGEMRLDGIGLAHDSPALANAKMEAFDALAIHSAQAQPLAQSKYAPPYPDQSDEWAVVPRVPTKAMIDACCKIKLDRLEALRDGHGASSGIVAAAQEEWTAMVTAAPRKRHDTINLLDDATPQPPAASVTDWTDAQCVAFMAVGLRHTEYKKGKSPTVEEIRQGAKAALAAQENRNG